LDLGGGLLPSQEKQVENNYIVETEINHCGQHAELLPQRMHTTSYASLTAIDENDICRL